MAVPKPKEAVVKTTFPADQFVPTEWSTAEDKARFANHFLRFVESGFAESLFPQWFYKRLSMTFGHIAHYDRGGFFGTFFASAAGKVRFLRVTVHHSFHGDPKFTYSDVERAVAGAVRAGGYLEKYERLLADEIETAERGELARLKAKYDL